MLSTASLQRDRDAAIRRAIDKARSLMGDSPEGRRLIVIDDRGDAIHVTQAQAETVVVLKLSAG